MVVMWTFLLFFGSFSYSSSLLVEYFRFGHQECHFWKWGKGHLKSTSCMNDQALFIICFICIKIVIPYFRGQNSITVIQYDISFYMTRFQLGEGSRYQMRWIFGKVPKRGRGVIFNPKIYIAVFGNFKQGFLSKKLIKRRVISGFRVCFFNNCIDINWHDKKYPKMPNSHKIQSNASKLKIDTPK